MWNPTHISVTGKLTIKTTRIEKKITTYFYMCRITIIYKNNKLKTLSDVNLLLEFIKN